MREIKSRYTTLIGIITAYYYFTDKTNNALLCYSNKKTTKILTLYNMLGTNNNNIHKIVINKSLNNMFKYFLVKY